MPSEHGTGEVRLRGKVMAAGMIPDRDAWLQGPCLLGFPRSQSMMLFQQQGVPWPGTVVPLEAVAFWLQGGEVSGRHEAWFAMEKTLFHSGLQC